MFSNNFNLYTIYDHRFNLLLVSPEIKTISLVFLWIQDQTIIPAPINKLNNFIPIPCIILMSNTSS